MCDKDTLQTEDFYKILFKKIDCGKEAALIESGENGISKFSNDFNMMLEDIFITMTLQMVF